MALSGFLAPLIGHTVWHQVATLGSAMEGCQSMLAHTIPAHPKNLAAAASLLLPLANSIRSLLNAMFSHHRHPESLASNLEVLQEGTGLERPQLVELLLRYPAAWDMSPVTVVQHLGQLGGLLGLSKAEALQVVGGALTGVLREAVVVAMQLLGADPNACGALLPC